MTDSPTYMDVAPDGRRLVLPADDRIELWDLQDLSRGPLGVVGRHEARVVSATFSPDGRSLLSHDVAARTRLWSLNDAGGELQREFPPEAGLIYKRFDAEGRRVALSGSAGLSIYNLDQGASIAPQRLRSHACVYGGTFSPDGAWVVTTGADGHVGAWPLTRELPLDLVLDAEGGAMLVFAPDGRRLYSSDSRGRIRAWPLADRLVGDPILLHEASGAQYSSLCIDDSGRFLFGVICSNPQGFGTLTRLDLAGGGIEVWDGIGCRIAVDPTGRYVASGAVQGLGKGYARVLDTRTGSQIELVGPGGGPIHVAGIARDGRVLAFGSEGLGLWDPVVGTEERLGDAPAWAVLASDRETAIVFEQGTHSVLVRRLDEDPSQSFTVPLDRTGLAIVMADSFARHVVVGRGNGDLEILRHGQGASPRIAAFRRPQRLSGDRSPRPLDSRIARRRDPAFAPTRSPLPAGPDYCRVAHPGAGHDQLACGEEC